MFQHFSIIFPIRWEDAINQDGWPLAPVWQFRHCQERYALDLCRQQGGRILDVGAGVRVLWRDGKMKTAMEGQVYLMWMWSSC